MLSFVVPRGAKPGSKIQIKSPTTGAMIECIIPKGAKAGRKLQVPDPSLQQQIQQPPPVQGMVINQPPPAPSPSVQTGSSSESMEFSVPQGAYPGMMLELKAPDGRTLSVAVPEGATPGMVMRIAVPPPSESGTSPPFVTDHQPSSEPTLEPAINDETGDEISPDSSVTGTVLQSSNSSVGFPSEPVMGTVRQSSNSGATGFDGKRKSKRKTELRTSTLDATFVIPPGAGPGTILQIPHPKTGTPSLYTVPPNTPAGTNITITFKTVEEVELQDETVTVMVPKRYKKGKAVKITLPNGRKFAVKFPDHAKPGRTFTITIPSRGDLEELLFDAKLTAKEHFKAEDYPNGDSDLVIASMHSGLSFDELILVVWRKKDTVFRCDMSTIGPAIYNFIDGDGDGEVTIDEMIAAMEDENIRAYVTSVKCPVLGKLFHDNPRKQRKAFRKIDKNNSGSISMTEWRNFLARVQSDRLHFYRRQFLLKDYVYMGLGMEPGAPYTKTQTFCCCYPVYRGYWDDFSYYACNNHPVLMIFYSDHLHPYSRLQRGFEFMGCLASAFFGSGVLLTTCDDNMRLLKSIYAVTLPTAFFRQVVYWLFTMPCLLHDESKTSGTKHQALTCCSDTAAALAYLFSFAWILVFLIAGSIFWAQDSGHCDEQSGGTELAYFLFSLCQYWVLWFIGVLLLDFNPFYLKIKDYKVVKIINKIMGYVVSAKIGRWYIEREMIFGIIREKIEERGIDQFFMPDQARGIKLSIDDGSSTM